MKSYCLVCKNLLIKNKKRLMLKSNCSVCENKKICLLGGGLVYLIV